MNKETREIYPRTANLVHNLVEALVRKLYKPPVLQGIELETEERTLDNPALDRIVRLYLQIQLGRPLREVVTRIGDTKSDRWIRVEPDEFVVYKKHRLTENRILVGVDYILRQSNPSRSALDAFTSVLDVELETAGKVAVREIGFIKRDEFQTGGFSVRKYKPPIYGQHAYRSFEVSQEGDGLVVDFFAGMELSSYPPDYTTHRYILTNQLRNERIALQNSQGIPFVKTNVKIGTFMDIIDIIPQWHAGEW